MLVFLEFPLRKRVLKIKFKFHFDVSPAFFILSFENQEILVLLMCS